MKNPHFSASIFAVLGCERSGYSRMTDNRGKTQKYNENSYSEKNSNKFDILEKNSVKPRLSAKICALENLVGENSSGGFLRENQVLPLLFRNHSFFNRKLSIPKEVQQSLNFPPMVDKFISPYFPPMVAEYF